MADKYEFVGEPMNIKFDGQTHTVCQIRALRDIDTEVHAGDLGGFIETERNLSHVGTCWVKPGGIILGKFAITGSAVIVRGCFHGFGELFCGTWDYPLTIPMVVYA